MTLTAALFLLSAQATQAPSAPAGAAAQASAEPRIEAYAMPLEKALPLIGERLGVPMRAAPAIGDELVLVSFTSRDAAAFRDQMAKAFSAEWRESEGVWYMNRSASVRAAEEKENRRKRLERITNAMEKSRKAANPDAEFNAADAEGLVKDLKSFMALPKPREDQYDEKYYGKARSLDQRGPSNRVIRRIVARLPLEMLDSEGGEPQRIVYSSRPTKMQLPMPFDIMPEISRYVREQNMWSEAMSASGIGENNGTMYTSLLYRKERVDKVPATVLLILQDRYGSRQVSVKAYDSDGRQVLEESDGIGYYEREENDALEKQMKENPRKVKLQLTPESKRYAEVFDDDATRRKAKGITAADYAPYLDVAKRDPMSYGASDILFSVARGENRNLVVRMDDTYFYFGYAVQQPEFAKDGMLDANFLNYFSTTTEEAGWTRLTPRDPEQSRRSFYDRRDLARAMTIAAQGGRMTVERQAELALVTPDQSEQKPMARLLNLVSGQRNWGTDDFLRLYGTLTPQQRKMAESEAGLSFNGLSDASKGYLARLAYLSDEWRLNYNPSPELQKSFKDGQDPNQELFYNGYLREPTFSLPDGLPRTGVIRITSDTEDKIKTGPMTRRWGTQEGQIMSAEELASNEYQRANPKRFPWAQEEYNVRNLQELTLVNQQSVNIEIRFDARITTNSVLTSDEGIAGGPFTLKTLPKKFLDAYAKAMKEQEEMYKDQPLPDYGDAFERNRGGGGTPPPAP